MASLVCEGAKNLKNLKKLPAWAVQSAQVESALPSGESGYTVLHDTRDITVDSKGIAHVTTRQSIRITGLKGRNRAFAAVPYLSDTEKVESFNAWLIKNDGTAYQYDKRDIVDRVQLSAGTIVSTARAKAIDATGDATIGTVFITETVTQEQGFILSWQWAFDGPSPNIYSSLSVTIPEQWRLFSYFLNMEDLPALREGNTYRWTLKNQAALPEEEWSPSRLQKMVDINVQPPEGSALENKIVSLSTWEDYAAYFTDKYKTRAGTKSILSDKIRELAPANATRVETIRALASFARSVNYVAIGLDLGKGGGWYPRSAAEVCETNYGDCKDKSNMLCHMLAEFGIKAHPVIVHSGLRNKVEESWPSGSQFNHCIAAIEVDSEFEGGSVIEHPDLGRLLILDPTDDLTAVGDLHINLQGSKGLLLAGENGGLIELPIVEPDRNLLDRQIEAEILPNGTLLARLNESAIGQEGRPIRGAYRKTEKSSDYEQRLKRRIASSVSSPKVGTPEIVDDLDGDRFELSVEFAAPQYAKTMGGTLMVFKPSIIGRRNGLPFKDQDERTQDLILAADHVHENSKIYLPAGYRVSEYTPEIHIEETFGEYRKTISIQDDTLISHRVLLIRSATLPVDQYDTAKAFFQKISDADQDPVVLEKI